MSARLPFTQAQVARTIAAARKAGLRVVGIRPDGIVLVNDGDNGPDLVPALPNGVQAVAASKWEATEV